MKNKLLISAGMKNMLLLALISSFVIQSCAQSKHGIVHARAFYQQRFSGTAIADDSGHVIGPGTDTVRIIYVETKSGDNPGIDSVLFHNWFYSATAYPVEKYPMEAGKRKAGNEPVIISPAKGHFLWRVELSPVHPVRSVPGNKIRLTGILSGKRYWITVDPVIELEAEQRG